MRVDVVRRDREVIQVLTLHTRNSPGSLRGRSPTSRWAGLLKDATADDSVFADRGVLDPLVESEKSFPEPIRSGSWRRFSLVSRGCLATVNLAVT